MKDQNFIKSIHKVYESHIKIIEYKNAYKKPNQKNKQKKQKKLNKNKKTAQEVSIQRTKTKITDYALSNKFQYFITLTLDPNKIESRYDYEIVSNEMTKFLRTNIKKYLLVPEKHKDQAYHFHLLANLEKKQLTKSHHHINLKPYKLGYSDIKPIKQTNIDRLKVAHYIQKYITKDLANAVPDYKKRYWVSKNLIKPTVKYNLPTPYDSRLVHRSDFYDVYYVFLDKDLKLAYNATHQSKLFKGVDHE